MKFHPLAIALLLLCSFLITISSCKKNEKCNLDCGTHGICDDDTKKCECNEGWTGEFCQTEIITSVCDTLDCGEHGTCNEDTGVCDCANGWMGTLCDVQTMACDTLDCGENGTCNPDTKMCDCADGWMGLFCDEEDLCFGLECANGECNPITGECECEEGWEGANCDQEIIMICDTLNCGNNGTCNQVTGLCDCLEGWEGANCDQQIIDCSTIDCGENGSCILDNGIPVCMCNEDASGVLLFSGEFCEDCIAYGGPCPDNSTCTTLGCQCDEGYVLSSDFTECVLPESNDDSVDMYFGSYLQTDESCTDTSIDPAILVNYATVEIVPNGSIPNQVWFKNLAALGSDVIVFVKDNPRFFEIPEQTTLQNHYFKGLTTGSFTTLGTDTVAVIQYTLTPVGGIPDTCIMTLNKQ